MVYQHHIQIRMKSKIFYFKQEHDANPLSNQQFSVTIPENILLNQQMTNSMVHYPQNPKRQRGLEDQLEHSTNGPLSPNKKSRIGAVDGSKLIQQSSPNKSSKKNRNKQQQQQLPLPQPQTIIKTAASGIFPQQQTHQTVNLQTMEESSDDVSPNETNPMFSHHLFYLKL